MAIIDEVREYAKELNKEGSLRTNLPPKANEKYYNPVEGAPRKQLEQLRDKHLRHIVKWAYEKSKFYKELWDGAGVNPYEIKGYDDLEKLPVWRKDQQRKDEAEFPPFGSRAVKELMPYVPRLYKSTGTSGAPTTYLWTADDFKIIAETFCRCLWSGGYRPGGALIDFFPRSKGQIVPDWAEASAENIGILLYAEEISGYFPDPEASARSQIELGRFYKPLCTCMTPEFLMTLGRQFKKMGEESPYDVILPAGMPLTPKGVQELLALFKKPKHFINIMSSNDGVVLYGCQPASEHGREDLHESEDLYVIEVVKPGSSRRCSTGERGELVFTTFFNHAAPLIRFGMEDVFENSYTTEICDCGRTTKRWLKLCPGRLKDIFKVKGKELLPWDVEVVIGDVPDSTLVYQLTLDNWDMDKLKLKVETLHKLPDPEYEKEVKTILETRLGVPAELELVTAGAVPTQAGGYKTVKVVDNRPK